MGVSCRTGTFPTRRGRIKRWLKAGVIEQRTDKLTEMGLELSPSKTRMAHPLQPEGGEAGFNVLGFQVRQYPASQNNTAQGHDFKTLIKPSKEAIKRHYRHLTETISRNKVARQENLIG